MVFSVSTIVPKVCSIVVALVHVPTADHGGDEVSSLGDGGSIASILWCPESPEDSKLSGRFLELVGHAG